MARVETKEHSLLKLVDSFLAHLQIERGLSQNTCDGYRGDCRRFVLGLTQDLRSSPEKLSEKEVFAFLVREVGRSGSSVRRMCDR